MEAPDPIEARGRKLIETEIVAQHEPRFAHVEIEAMDHGASSLEPVGANVDADVIAWIEEADERGAGLERAAADFEQPMVRLKTELRKRPHLDFAVYPPGAGRPAQQLEPAFHFGFVEIEAVGANFHGQLLRGRKWLPGPDSNRRPFD